MLYFQKFQNIENTLGHTFFYAFEVRILLMKFNIELKVKILGIDGIVI